MQTIDIKDWPFIIDLERAFYEKHAYESLLSYMARNQIGNTQDYFQEYIGVIKNYYKLCKQLENEVILPITQEPVFWEVNFDGQFITIKENPS